MNKVGIVILNFNSMKYLPLTLESLVRAKGEVPFVVGVIDNGSSKDERDACEKLVKQYDAKYEVGIHLFRCRKEFRIQRRKQCCDKVLPGKERYYAYLSS